MYTITLADIMLYIGDGVRMLREGEAVYKAQHIIFAGWDERNAEIKAACLRSTTPKQSPHLIQVKICEAVDQWCLHCSCKGGVNGRCKHSVATLLYVYK